MPAFKLLDLIKLRTTTFFINYIVS